MIKEKRNKILEKGKKTRVRSVMVRITAKPRGKISSM